MKKGLISAGLLLVIGISFVWLLMDSQAPESDMASIEPTQPAIPSQPQQPAETSAPAETDAIELPSATPTEIPPRLSADAIKNCPVTRPNEVAPRFGSNYGFNHGNEAETIFTILEDDGRWVFWPGGPGEILEDGSLRIKWPWWRTVEGDVKISGERLDANAPQMPEEILRGEEDGYEETGFHPSRLTFPSEGCWEISARVGEERLSFVLLVILRDG